MKCPACAGTLQPRAFFDAEPYICDSCEGIWFERGLVPRVLRSIIASGKAGEETVKEAFGRKAEPLDARTQSRRECPVCHAPLEPFNYMYDSNVVIDKCASCGGMWTDKDEIFRIARHVRGNAAVNALGRSLVESEREHSSFIQRIAGLSEDLNARFSFGRLLAWQISFFPIPLRDENPVVRFPYATVTVIALNLIACAYQIAPAVDLRTYINVLGLVPAAAFEPGRLYAFLTSMFVHGGFLHLAGNMYFLWLFGDNIEDKLGPLRFLSIYFLCGVAGSLMFIWAHPTLSYPVIGASGAISGLMGMYLMLFPGIRMNALWLGRIRDIPVQGYLIFWIMIQLMNGSMELCTDTMCTVAFWDHIGGFFCGLIIGIAARLRIGDSPDRMP